MEEAGGGRGGAGSVMPSDLSQRRALLFLPPPGQRLPDAALEPELPAEVEAGLAFQLLGKAGGSEGERPALSGQGRGGGCPGGRLT